MNFVDYTGRRYGKLVVLRRGVRNERRGLYEWVCQCDCGNIKSIIGADLKTGNTISCGCMSSRKSSNNATKTHGMTNTPLYSVWTSMRTRCTNEKSKSYKDYGGRGITICDKWKTFEGFYEDMGDSYENHLTLERKNNEEGYSLENCEWIPKSKQTQNRRNNNLQTYKGETLPLKTLCKINQVKYGLVAKRMRLGWDIVRAIETPARKFTLKDL